MPSTALAFKNELDEVPVSATDEASVARVRDDIKELRSELRAMASKAASDLKEMWDRIDRQFAYFREDMREMRAETRQLREKVDSQSEKLNARIDATHQEIGQTNKELGQLASAIDRIRNRFGALQWILSGLGALGGLIAGVATLGSAFHWF